MTATAKTAPRPGEEALPINLQRNIRRTASIVVLCAFVGIVCFIFYLLAITADISTEAPDEVIDARLDQYGGFLLLSMILGAVSLALLPKAIQHDPREGQIFPRYPGRRGTLIAAIVVCLCSVSPLAWGSGVVTFISVISRRATSWTIGVLVAMVTAAVLATVVDPDMSGWADYALTLAVEAILLVPLLIIGQSRGQRREEHWRLLAEAQQTQRIISEKEQLARQEERAHIARDMHDSLSHRLSTIAIHAGLLSARGEEFDAATRQGEAELIREEAAKAVEDLRQVLSVLRANEAKRPDESLEEVVAAAQRAGDNVTLTVDPHTKRLFDGAENGHVLPTVIVHTLHRAVQEGLTNARKHAPGAPVQVAVETSTTGSQIHLRISNPILPGQQGEGSRMGLIGLQERAELVGGRLAVTHGDAFVLDLYLPTEADPPNHTSPSNNPSANSSADTPTGGTTGTTTEVPR